PLVHPENGERRELDSSRQRRPREFDIWAPSSEPPSGDAPSERPVPQVPSTPPRREIFGPSFDPPSPSSDERTATGPYREEISMTPGDGSIARPETPASGYRWTLTKIPRGVAMLDDYFTVGSIDPSVPRKFGDGGTRIFRVHVDAEGVYSLRFVRKRPW